MSCTRTIVPFRHVPGIEGFQIFSLGTQAKMNIKKKVVYEIEFVIMRAQTTQYIAFVLVPVKMRRIWRRRASLAASIGGL
jgi:hypothetical protein